MLFAEWQTNGPKATAARDFICDAFARAVAEARAKAETDFDEAVAVSEDGRRIITADEVVVVTADGRVHSWAPEAFRERKILLASVLAVERVNNAVAQDNKSLYVHTSRLHHFHGEQIFYRNIRSGELSHSRFLTHESMCPVPLPDGGTLITDLCV